MQSEAKAKWPYWRPALRPASRASHTCWRLAFTVILSGCGGSSELADVQGTVRLNGNPLHDAFLTFIPLDKSGGPSYGRTDQNGRYQMTYTSRHGGVVFGKSRVRITTADITIDEQGRERRIPELVPAKYNRQSELIVIIEPGRNVIDFDLDAKPASDGQQSLPQ